MTLEARHPKARLAGLPGAEDFAGAAQGQVLFGDVEAVLALTDDLEPFPADLAEWGAVEQDAVALAAAAADAAAQLMELGQPQALRVFDHH